MLSRSSRRGCFFFLLFLAFSFLSATAFAAGEYFRELKGDHFIVYYPADEGFAREVLREAEAYYHSIAGRLGYDRFDKFWTWDNRVKIYLFADREDFLTGTRAPGWSGGFANHKLKILAGYPEAENFLARVLPHEITHLMFRDFVGTRRGIPLWLDEGVALAMESGRREEFDEIARRALRQKAWMPLDRLARVRSAASLGPETAAVFYAEAALAVDFLLSGYGRDKFTEFCRQLRDGKAVDEALRKVYGPDGIENLQDLENRLFKTFVP